MINRIIILLVFLSTCATKNNDAEPILIGDVDLQSLRNEYENRLDNMIEPEYWVLSYRQNGDIVEPFDQGDSLIFSGIAMGVGTCDGIGEKIETALLDSMPIGTLFRHPTLSDKISMDGALGLMFGIAARWRFCDQAEVLKKWSDFVAAINPKKLNPNSDVGLPLEFGYVLDVLKWKMGIQSEPNISRRAVLETQISTWAHAVVESKSACYRIHLGWLALRTLELLGNPASSLGKASYCSAIDPGQIPLIRHWCGGNLLVEYAKQYQTNEWSYRHQRCGGWETADGAQALRPGVDMLVALWELERGGQ